MLRTRTVWYNMRGGRKRIKIRDENFWRTNRSRKNPAVIESRPCPRRLLARLKSFRPSRVHVGTEKGSLRARSLRRERRGTEIRLRRTRRVIENMSNYFPCVRFMCSSTRAENASNVRVSRGKKNEKEEKRETCTT